MESVERLDDVVRGAEEQRRDGGLLAEDGGRGEDDRQEQRAPAAQVLVRAPLDVLAVREEREQVEVAGGQVGAAHDARHGLGVHRVRGEQQPGHGDGRRGRQQQPAHLHDQPRRQAVQQHVDQVVAGGLEAAEQVVQLEREHAQRPIRAVGARVDQRRAPEVVAHDLVPRRRVQNVRIAENRSPGKQKRRKDTFNCEFKLITDFDRFRAERGNRIRIFSPVRGCETPERQIPPNQLRNCKTKRGAGLRAAELVN